MGRVFRPTYKDRHGVTKRVANWYVEYTDAAGKTRRRRVGKDKRLAEQVLARDLAGVDRVRAGFPADPTPAAAHAVATLRDEYLAVLAARGRSGGHLRGVTDQLAAIVPGCKWVAWPDITPDSLVLYLGRRRDEHGNGPATLNAYLRTAKGFSKWAAAKLGVPSPLRGVPPWNEQVDRRRSKRILTDAELAALIAAAEACPPRGRADFPGKDRAMLYRVAAYTGLRASELAAMTPGWVALDAPTPVVTVPAEFAKGRREEPVPLPAHLVAALRPWLAGRPADARLWPGRWAAERRQVRWVARDVKRAGIAAKDDRGRGVTFHGLKRRYVVGLIRADGKVDEVRRLARHKDVRTTLNYYTDQNMPDLGRLVDKLPPPGG